MPKKEFRPESEIWKDLEGICVSPGYCHAIAFFCRRDNFINIADGLSAEILAPRVSSKTLIRSEITTLIGLMLKGNIAIERPSEDILLGMIVKTESLLVELHEALTVGFYKELASDVASENGANPFASGMLMREPIFYAAESAYNFQYRDFCIEKYAADDDWLLKNKGFNSKDFVKISAAINHLQNKKMQVCSSSIGSLENLLFLPAFTFSLDEIVKETSMDERIVESFLTAFSITAPENTKFDGVGSFNLANSHPIIQLNDKDFCLFQMQGLLESFYESPFFWMRSDPQYIDQAMENRANFLEDFCAKRLATVFGAKNVFKNIKIYEGKDEVGEIDVLVVFLDRAIILQGKSKKLTLAARQGSDKSLQDDFQKAVQDAYGQGLSCAEFLPNKKYKLIDAAGRELTIRRDFHEIFIVCAISDHYPSLAFQTKQFLKYKTSDVIRPPYVMDIFFLDVFCEMLNTPMQFLSFMHRRVEYHEKIVTANEFEILSIHLIQNLWIEDEYDILMAGADTALQLDTAMMVRREGFSGEATPDGILTRFQGTFYESLLLLIGNLKSDKIVDLAYLLLSLNEETINNLNEGAKIALAKFKADGASHDFSIGVEGSGLSIHFNPTFDDRALEKLNKHCERRKYSQKASCWFGISLNSTDLTLDVFISKDFPFAYDKEMDALVTSRLKMITAHSKASPVVRKDKVGRNDDCPCGSKKKYKKCCMGAD